MPVIKNNWRKKKQMGDKYTDALYQAVKNYVESRGGSVVVIGGIALVQETSLKFNYGVMVRVTGKKPEVKPPFPKPKKK